MRKIFILGGVLSHAVVGTWPAFAAAAQNQPISWFVVGLHALGPGMLSVLVAVLAFLMHSPPQVVRIAEQIE